MLLYTETSENRNQTYRRLRESVLKKVGYAENDKYLLVYFFTNRLKSTKYKIPEISAKIAEKNERKGIKPVIDATKRNKKLFLRPFDSFL